MIFYIKMFLFYYIFIIYIYYIYVVNETSFINDLYSMSIILFFDKILLKKMH